MASNKNIPTIESTYVIKPGPVLSDIQRRLGERREVEKEWQAMKLPILTSTESFKAFKKVIGEMKDRRLDKDFLEVEDFTCVIRAFFKAAEELKFDPNKYINEAWYQHPIGAEQKKILDERAVAEAEAREKQYKAESKAADGKSPGQKKMIKDDGSIAEEATAAKTEKLTAENDPAKEKKGGKKDGKAPAEIGTKEVGATELSGKQSASSATETTKAADGAAAATSTASATK